MAKLIKEILNLEGLERFRLSSVEPNTFTDELLDVLKSSPKVLDHFHVPLQSGSDAILKSMRRKYDVRHYKDVILKLKEAFPHCAIGADIILGHPGEETEDFNATYQLLKELPITHFHAFPYSKRQGTTASKLPDHVSGEVKKNRVSLINGLGSEKLISFSEEMVGKFNEVLFERRNKEGLFEGYTSNFVRTMVDTKEDLSNQIRKVFIEEAENGVLRGRLVDELV